MFHLLITFLFQNFILFYTGELESTASEASHITRHTSFVKHGDLELITMTTGSKFKSSNPKTPRPWSDTQIKDHVKDSGIDTGLSSSCNTLSEEVLKSKVYKPTLNQRLQIIIKVKRSEYF